MESFIYLIIKKNTTSILIRKKKFFHKKGAIYMRLTLQTCFLGVLSFRRHTSEIMLNVYKNIRLKSKMRGKVIFTFVCFTMITKSEIRNIKIFYYHQLALDDLFQSAYYRVSENQFQHQSGESARFHVLTRSRYINCCIQQQQFWELSVEFLTTSTRHYINENSTQSIVSGVQCLCPYLIFELVCCLVDE